MNISSQEQQALFTSKLIEGKSEQEARNEIIRDLKFIKDFNSTKKELERILNILEREIAKRQVKLEKIAYKSKQAQNQAIKSIANPNTYDSNIQKLATTTILKRVIHYLEEHPNSIDSEKIANFCCISVNQAKDAQLFINKFIRLS